MIRISNGMSVLGLLQGGGLNEGWVQLGFN